MTEQAVAGNGFDMTNPKDSFGGESIVMVFIFLLILGVGVDVGFQLRDKQSPAEIFKKTYVVGCELTPTTFTFPDGAKLIGDFAKCAADSHRSFFAATTRVAVPKKGDVTVHTVMENDNGSTYPVVTVYAPLTIDPTSRAASASLSEVTPADLAKDDVMATSTSDGQPLQSFVIVQRGYLMGLFSKSTGFSFDQGSLTYNPPAAAKTE